MKRLVDMTNEELAEIIVADRISHGQFTEADRDWLIERELRESRESLENGVTAILHWDEEKKEETYAAMTARHQKEWDNMVRDNKPLVFYAIGDSQFKEALEAYVNFCGNDKDIVKFGCGLYGRKDIIEELCCLADKNYDEFYDSLMNNKDFAIEAFMYEMNNHDYGWTMNDDEILEALGLSYADLSDDVISWYNLAQKQYLESVSDYIW